MAGGNFTDMNKVRPGVYYKRLIDDKLAATDLPQNTLCYIVPLRWGKPITRITLDDYSRNRVYQLSGLQNNDDRIQIFAQYCRELVLANPLVGGKAAEAIIREEQSEEGSVDATITAGAADATIPEKAQITHISGERSYTQLTLGRAGVSFQYMNTGDILVGVITGVPKGFTPTSPTVTKVVMKAGATSTVEASDITATFNADIDGYSLTFDSSITEAMLAEVASITVSASGTHAYDLDSGFSAIVNIDGTSVKSKSSDWTEMTVEYKIVSVEELKAVAQYAGTLGNELSIVVVRKSGTQLDVRTTLDGSIVDSQVVATWAQWVDNDWVRLEGLRDGTPSVSDPINLSGGEDGEVAIPERIQTDDMTALGGAIKVRYGFAEDDDSNVNVDGVYLTVDEENVYVKRSGAVLATVSRLEYTPISITFTLPANMNDGQEVAIALKLFVYDEDNDEWQDVAVAAERYGMDEIEWVRSMPLDMVLDLNPAVLNGGNHGDSAPYGDLLNALRFEPWNVLVSDDQSGTSHHYLHDYVQGLRNNCGLYRRYVLCQVPSDPFSGENEYNADFCTVMPQVWRDNKGFSAFVRGAMACCGYTSSNTYQEVPLDEEPSPMFTDREIESLLVSGYSPVSKRDDGVIVIEKDINSFHEYENPVYYPLTKNRILRTIDYFCTFIRYVWELEYCGKVTNDAIGRDMWKSRVIGILKDFLKARAIESYVDPVVLKGNKVDEVITRCGFHPLDCMEICYFELTLNN